MSLLRKVRILMGALVRKPFMPHPEKVDLDEVPKGRRKAPARQDSPELEAREADVPDTERVADLIAQQQGEEAD